MSNPKKTHELIRQNEQIVEKSQKHDANLQKNSTIYFQIGLIVCLLTVYGLFEMKFETTIPPIVCLGPPDEPIYVHIPEIRHEVPDFVEPVEQSKSKSTTNFKEVIDDTPLKDFVKDIEPTKDFVPPVDTAKVIVLDKPVDDAPVHFLRIEQVPIYPGCEKAKGNEERKQCMSEKITKLVQRKFDGTIASDYGLSGMQKIDVQFTIDKTGHIKDVKTRSPHPKLDEEAERVISILPKMLPGKQRDKPVGVIYTLPIVFDVQ
jgi:periplasmic protein TonB